MPVASWQRLSLELVGAVSSARKLRKRGAGKGGQGANIDKIVITFALP